MHAAVYKAVVGIAGRDEPYRFHPQATHRASSQAAAIAAAHKVLVTYSPEQSPMLDAANAASLADIPDGRAKTRGVAYGELAADAIIAQRLDDGRNDASIQFTRLPGAGVASHAAGACPVPRSMVGIREARGRRRARHSRL